MGSHATCSGARASGPEDYARVEYQWGYNRMMTVDGLFGAGDTIGALRTSSWELPHRVLASESVTHHTLFREETRWSGYYYRAIT